METADHVLGAAVRSLLDRADGPRLRLPSPMVAERTSALSCRAVRQFHVPDGDRRHQRPVQKQNVLDRHGFRLRAASEQLSFRLPYGQDDPRGARVQFHAAAQTVSDVHARRRMDPPLHPPVFLHHRHRLPAADGRLLRRRARAIHLLLLLRRHVELRPDAARGRDLWRENRFRHAARQLRR